MNTTLVSRVKGDNQVAEIVPGRTKVGLTLYVECIIPDINSVLLYIGRILTDQNLGLSSMITYIYVV